MDDEEFNELLKSILPATKEEAKKMYTRESILNKPSTLQTEN